MRGFRHKLDVKVPSPRSYGERYGEGLRDLNDKGVKYSPQMAPEVSQERIWPLFRPVTNQRWRWAAVPWVKLSGTT